MNGISFQGIGKTNHPKKQKKDRNITGKLVGGAAAVSVTKPLTDGILAETLSKSKAPLSEIFSKAKIPLPEALKIRKDMLSSFDGLTFKELSSAKRMVNIAAIPNISKNLDAQFKLIDEAAANKEILKRGVKLNFHLDEFFKLPKTQQVAVFAVPATAALALLVIGTKVGSKVQDKIKELFSSKKDQ